MQILWECVCSSVRGSRTRALIDKRNSLLNETGIVQTVPPKALPFTKFGQRAEWPCPTGKCVTPRHYFLLTTNGMLFLDTAATEMSLIKTHEEQRGWNSNCITVGFGVKHTAHQLHVQISVIVATRWPLSTYMLFFLNRKGHSTR